MKNSLTFGFLTLALLLTGEAASADSQYINLKADLRFRTENIKEEQVAPLATSDRTRQRIRMRLTASGRANDTTEGFVRVSTGSNLNTDATTTNQDLTDYYAKKNLVIDMAYVNWKPDDSFVAMAGKTPIPFYLAGGSDLIFDADLTPEGLSFKYNPKFESGMELFFNGSATWLQERFSATGATDNTDVGLVGGQIGTSYKGESWNATLALATYNFSNIKGATAPAAKGNTLTAGAYAKDYKLTSIDLELGTKLAEVPLVVFGETVTNSEGGDYKNGVIYGVKFGKLKDKGNWALSIDDRELEKDSTVGILADSDSSGGGADIHSTRVSGGYQLADNANISATLFSGKKALSSTTFSPAYTRAQLDFNLAF